MAQDGDVINYTFNNNTDSNRNLIPQKEDVTAVDEAIVNFCDGAGGQSFGTNGGSGGRVENATIDVSSQSILYIWVADFKEVGRYKGGRGFSTRAGIGGGSTEISFSSSNQADSSDEPFLVASGGGGGGNGSFDGNGGAREGVGETSVSGLDGAGIAPPKGGSPGNNSPDGQGGIDDQNRGLVSAGTTITGGGSGQDTNGEIQIEYKIAAPAAPSGLTLTIQ
jgi:hypothetical protein